MKTRTKKLNTPAALAFGLLTLVTSAGSTEVPAATISARIDTYSNMIAEASIRLLSKSATYCTARHQPPGASLDEQLKAYAATASAGTREAMLEIAKTDPDFFKMLDVMSSSDLAKLDERGTEMLKNTQAEPEALCSKLSKKLAQPTLATFKELTLQGYRESRKKRGQ